MEHLRPATKAEQREATVHRLIEVGRALFTAYGYAQTSTEAIVKQAGVTRGALYHHFANKEQLFRAILDTVQRDVAQRVEAATDQHADPWQQLVAGCRAFLSASLEPDVQRIMLVDGPAVLGWEVWREMDARYSMKSLHDGLGELSTAGGMQPLSLDALVHLLSGAMNEAALWIARSSRPQQALAEAIAAFEKLLEGLRRPQ